MKFNISILVLALSGCLFSGGSNENNTITTQNNLLDSSPENNNNDAGQTSSTIGQTSVPEPTCDGKILDFDIVTIENGGFASVESCDDYVILKKRSGNMIETLMIWETGSPNVSLAEHNNVLYVGTSDRVYECAQTCGETKVFVDALEVLVTVFDDEKGYLVNYADRIDFEYNRGNTTTKQEEVRFGNFTELHLEKTPYEENARMMATAHNNGIVYRFLEDGTEHNCPAHVGDRGSAITQLGAFIVAFRTKEDQIGFKVLSQGGCSSEEINENVLVKSFDISVVASDISLVARHIGNDAIIELISGFTITSGNPGTVNIDDGSQIKLTGTKSSYLFAALSDGSVSYHFGIFP